MDTARFEALESRQLMSVTLGENLLGNGDADHPRLARGKPPVLMNGWTTVGPFTAERYGAPDMPTTTSAGPANRGKYFFAGGKATILPNGQPLFTQTSAYQDVDVSSLATDINAGHINYSVSAYLGGYGNERDDMSIRLHFLGTGGAEIAAATMGDADPSLRRGQTGLTEFSMQSQVPNGTAKIRVEMIAKMTFGRYIDGYADDVALKLTAATGTKHGYVTGRVKNDTDGDGKGMTMEPGLPGVTVFADQIRNGKLDKGEPRAVTDAEGMYVLAGVTAGNAVIRQIVPKGFRATDTLARTVKVLGGLTTAAPDFRASRTGVIAGNVFNDANGNRKRDKLEKDLEGITVFLDGNGNGMLDAGERFANSDKNGNFSFVAQRGTYKLRRVESMLPVPGKEKPIIVKLGDGQKSFGHVFGVKFVREG